MMKAMRERVTIVYWVVIVSFVGLTFLVWGVGLDGGGGGGGPQGNTNSIATVNGVDITYDVYNETVKGVLNQMRAQLPEGESLSENQLMRARQQAFDTLVLETLERSEAEKMGLSVSDEEIVDILSNDPPQFLRAQFTDESGRFDTAAYKRALEDPNASRNWQQIERYLRAVLPLQKLENYVTGQAVVGEEEVREAFTEQSVRAVAEYLAVELSSIELEDETVDESSIAAFYEEHKDEFKVPEQAAVRVLSVPKEASEADQQDIVSILEEIRQDILSGRITFEEAARTYSEDSSNASQGGDLGFFDRDRMVQPFTDVAFALEVGDVSEPVKTQFGYHLIMVEDVKTDEQGEVTEVQARHVLLKLAPSDDTVATLRDLIDGVHATAVREGLDAAAAVAELEATTTAPFQESFNLPGVPNSLPGTRFAFSNDVGSLSPVFETQEMFYCFEVAERIPEGHRPLDEVRSVVSSRLQRDRRAEIASERLAGAWAQVQAGATLEEVGASDEFTHAVTDTFTLRENIPGVGFATAFARAALNLEPGQALPEVQTQRGVYIVKLLYKSEFDENAFEAQRASLSRTLLFNRQRQTLIQWQEQLREDADVVDRRDVAL